MLRRVRTLPAMLMVFCDEWERPDFVLDNEWLQIDYLYITNRVYEFTTELLRTRDVTIHYIFKIHNLFFNHIDVCVRRLTRKRVQ